MNIQTVRHEKINEVKARILEIQESIRTANLDIGNAQAAHEQHFNSAMKSRSMTSAEFMSLFPEPPIADITADITATQAKIDAIKLPTKRQKLIEELSGLEFEKSRLIASHAQSTQTPGRPLTADEFNTLYPKPNFAVEHAKRAKDQDECNALHAFLNSIQFPKNASQYDVDLLVGSSVSYP